MNHYDAILAKYPIGTPIGDCISTNKIYFLYGSIFPDAQFTNQLKESMLNLYAQIKSETGVTGLTYEINLTNLPDYDYPFGFDTHDPKHAFEFAEFMLQKFVPGAPLPPGPNPGNKTPVEGNPARGEKLAFVLGYYAHLCEDIMCHDFYASRLTAESNLGGLSILKTTGDQIPGEIEAAIEIMTDYRLGNSAVNLVKQTVFNDFWVRVGQLEPPFPLIVYQTESYIGLNPTILFFKACLDEWYALHPSYFQNPPISTDGLEECLHLFRFYNRFYPELIGYGYFPDKLAEWISTHIWYSPGVDILTLIPFFVTDIIRELMVDNANGLALKEIKGKVLESEKILFGIMNYNIGKADNIVSSVMLT